MKRLTLLFRAGAAGGSATRLRFSTDRSPEDGELPLLHSIDDTDGKGVIGIDVVPDGRLRVGCWDEHGDFQPKFAVSPLAPFEHNWREAPLLGEGTGPTTTDEVAGESPDRTITRRENGAVAVMMSEIDPGRFVGWDVCNRGHHISTCDCPGGPVEPEIVERWRRGLHPERTPVETRETRELREPEPQLANANYDAGF